MLPGDWVSCLVKKAEHISKMLKLHVMPRTSLQWCSCFSSLGDIDLDSAKSHKAACRENSNDNYLFCPTARDIQHGNLKHFQQHWVKGEPVIVSDVLEHTSGLSWEPMVMWRAFRQITHSQHSKHLDVVAIDCLDWSEVKINIRQFFKGYLEGRFHSSLWPQLLKLKDWPSSNSFEEHLPRHAAKFIDCLPFKEYTHPRFGFFNLAVKLPLTTLKPDLGPKIDIAYGVDQELGYGDSLTKLRCNMADAVIILTRVNAVTLTPKQLSKIEELKQKYINQDQREIFDNGSELGQTVEKQQLSPSMEKSRPGDSGVQSSTKAVAEVSSCCEVSSLCGGGSRSMPSDGRQYFYGGFVNAKEATEQAEEDINIVGDEAYSRTRKGPQNRKRKRRKLPAIFQSKCEKLRKDNSEKVNRGHQITAEASERSEVKKLDQDKSGKSAEYSNAGTMLDGLEHADCGSVWDLFRRQDVPKLQEYLKKHFRGFRHIYCSPLQQTAALGRNLTIVNLVVHPIHDQTFYFPLEHKRKLKEEYGIEPWTFVQKLGDAVFIPAGCPHQVRNLKSCIKVALDFVSAENVSECIRLTEEFHSLPGNHRAKEDKLEEDHMIISLFDNEFLTEAAPIKGGRFEVPRSEVARAVPVSSSSASLVAAGIEEGITISRGEDGVIKLKDQSGSEVVFEAIQVKSEPSKGIQAVGGHTELQLGESSTEAAPIDSELSEVPQSEVGRAGSVSGSSASSTIVGIEEGITMSWGEDGVVTLKDDQSGLDVRLNPESLFAGVREEYRAKLVHIFELRPDTFMLFGKLSFLFAPMILETFGGLLEMFERMELKKASQADFDELLRTLGDLKRGLLRVEWIEDRVRKMAARAKFHSLIVSELKLVNQKIDECKVQMVEYEEKKRKLILQAHESLKREEEISENRGREREEEKKERETRDWDLKSIDFIKIDGYGFHKIDGC
ncbi:hypothetical protein HYC85_023764 [Camellia sinensis]|uniref:JmjC domain-containing protein n=1 Tax=Camellia sinensis TaxID=4442 RepID=A0A7J7GGT2_CAMSI|nr:hypothetical protein HYC85_023764 [Camellia sinensis]